MKKFAFHKIIMVVCLILALTLLVCSCDNGDGEKTNEPTSTTTTAADSGNNGPTGSTPTTTTAKQDDPNGGENKPTTETYTVTVVDENGAPLSGAAVQLCVGDLCKLPKFTGSDGEISFDFEPADYKVKVTLAGYTCDAEGYSFPEGETELTVTMTKV